MASPPQIPQEVTLRGWITSLLAQGPAPKEKWSGVEGLLCTYIEALNRLRTDTMDSSTKRCPRLCEGR